MSDTEGLRDPYFQAPLMPQREYTLSLSSDPLLRIRHISDTNLGRDARFVLTTRPNGSQGWVETHIPSVRNFVAAIETLHELNPEFIVHSGDIVDGEHLDQDRIEEVKALLPELVEQTTVYCIRGNHDSERSLSILRELLPQWDIISLDKQGLIHEAEEQVALFGTDFQSESSDTSRTFSPPLATSATVTIGAFHQSVRNMAGAAPTVEPDDSSPGDLTAKEYYDILLLGHMHTDFFDGQHCAMIDGGSAGGMTYNTKPSIGLISLSPTAAHYRRYPVG